jgi:hypothetical protein
MKKPTSIVSICYGQRTCLFFAERKTDELGIRETLKTAKRGAFSGCLPFIAARAGSNKGAIWVPGSRNGFPSELVGPVYSFYSS